MSAIYSLVYWVFSFLIDLSQIAAALTINCSKIYVLGDGKMKALQDVVVLDLTRVLAGPYASMMLADFGAEIIKIEPPGVGDDSRAFGPFIGEESAYFMSLNRNKRSMTLNLKSPAARALFREM